MARGKYVNKVFLFVSYNQCFGARWHNKTRDLTLRITISLGISYHHDIGDYMQPTDSEMS